MAECCKKCFGLGCLECPIAEAYQKEEENREESQKKEKK